MNRKRKRERECVCSSSQFCISATLDLWFHRLRAPRDCNQGTELIFSRIQIDFLSSLFLNGVCPGPNKHKVTASISIASLSCHLSLFHSRVSHSPNSTLQWLPPLRLGRRTERDWQVRLILVRPPTWRHMYTCHSVRFWHYVRKTECDNWQSCIDPNSRNTRTNTWVKQATQKGRFIFNECDYMVVVVVVVVVGSWLLILHLELRTTWFSTFPHVFQGSASIAEGPLSRPWPPGRSNTWRLYISLDTGLCGRQKRARPLWPSEVTGFWFSAPAAYFWTTSGGFRALFIVGVGPEERWPSRIPRSDSTGTLRRKSGRVLFSLSPPHLHSPINLHMLTSADQRLFSSSKLKQTCSPAKNRGRGRTCPQWLRLYVLPLSNEMLGMI